MASLLLKEAVYEGYDCGLRSVWVWGWEGVLRVWKSRFPRRFLSLPEVSRFPSVRDLAATSWPPSTRVWGEEASGLRAPHYAYASIFGAVEHRVSPIGSRSVGRQLAAGAVE
jgi:hypothetical protein